MALPTPLTPAQVDGAADVGEVPVLFRTGPHTSKVLLVSQSDPNLPQAISEGSVIAPPSFVIVSAPTHNDADFPEIVGDLIVGQTVQADPVPAAWTGNPTFTYQWVRSGNPIPGAVNATYTFVAQDEGESFDVQVTGTNAGGSLTIGGNTRGPVLPQA